VKHRRIAPLIISLMVTVALFLVAEFAVRLAGIQPMEWPASEGWLPFRGIEVSPLLGPLPRPGWTGQWIGKFAVSADGRGFRSTGLPPPAAPRARVAFLGDSCTFGWGIDTPDTFVAQLDARQRTAGAAAFDFVNAAYPGQSAVVGTYLLRERVLPLDPTLVVVGFSANNAFRFSVVSDADRFRFFRVRKLMLHSRLFHIAAAWLANRTGANLHPRSRDVIQKVPVRELKRVATAEEFETALRRMVADTRSHGAVVLFLLLPRASGVSTEFGNEDAGRLARQLLAADHRVAGSPPSSRELNLLEASCLDHRAFDDPMRTLYERARDWHVVYPDDPVVRGFLQQGARAYVETRYAEAQQYFESATATQPDVPLARYDLGVAKLANGNREGLQDLAEADRLACNVFLEHQVILWRLAQELGVPVVDITLYFQAHDGEPLFLDPAHPNRNGHQIIAEALWPVIQSLVPTDKRR